MLTETPQPSSGPSVTPPAVSPGAGDSPSGEAQGSGHPQAQDTQALKDQAIQLVYGERFDQLIEMFQKNGPDKFARSMAIAVNTAISEIEKGGEIGPEAAAEVGSDLFAKLLEDMLVRPTEEMGPVVEGVTAEQLQEVMPAILVMYADSHPNVSKTDIQAVMAEVDSGVKASQGTNQTPDGGQMAANPAQPTGGPV
jgi:hypothetical protein